MIGVIMYLVLYEPAKWIDDTVCIPQSTEVRGPAKIGTEKETKINGISTLLVIALVVGRVASIVNRTRDLLLIGQSPESFFQLSLKFSIACYSFVASVILAPFWSTGRNILSYFITIVNEVLFKCLKITNKL